MADVATLRAGQLDEAERFQVQEARQYLDHWEQARGAEVYDIASTLASHLRNLLAIVAREALEPRP